MIIISTFSKKLSCRFAILIFLGFPLLHFGQSVKNYSLLKPVPNEQMRDMETDRPDVTESPYTIDAGHFQYETDIIRLEKEQSELRKSSTLLINQINIKVGLMKNTALQIGFQTYGRQKDTDQTGKSSIEKGFGDITVRVKQNIVGNDHGNFIMALLPYLKLPSSQFEDSRIESGLIVPMLYKLPGEWKLGFQVEVDHLKDKDFDAMHTELLQTLTLSHSLVQNLEAIAETYYTYDFKAHQLSNYINAALQFELVKNLKVDAGINYGLQHGTEKHYFLGASYRH